MVAHFIVIWFIIFGCCSCSLRDRYYLLGTVECEWKLHCFAHYHYTMDGGWVEVAAAAARRVMLWKSCWINLHFHHCLSFSLPSLPQMSGKRSRSFKCAVHQRDREITSENDFHILLQQPPFFERWVLLLSLMKSRHFDSSLGVYRLCRMVHVIAMEVLPEERDRKYYADNYSCCPPPLFVIFVTLVEVSTVLLLAAGSGIIFLFLRSFLTAGRIDRPTRCRCMRLDHGHVRGPSRIYYEAASSVGWCILMKGKRDPRQTGDFVQLKRRRRWWGDTLNRFRSLLGRVLWSNGATCFLMIHSVVKWIIMQERRVRRWSMIIWRN